MIYGLSNSGSCDDLACNLRSFIDCSLFQIKYSVVARFLLKSASHGFSATAELLVLCKVT